MALTVSVADLCQGTVFVCQEVDMPDQPNTIEVKQSEARAIIESRITVDENDCWIFQPFGASVVSGGCEG